MSGGCCVFRRSCGDLVDLVLTTVFGRGSRDEVTWGWVMADEL